MYAVTLALAKSYTDGVALGKGAVQGIKGDNGNVRINGALQS